VPQVKLVYLARRSLDLAADEFPARWRRHGELAMSLRNWDSTIAGYTQCDNIGDPWDGVAPGTGETWSDHEGVGSIWFHDEGAVDEFVSHPDFPQLLMDEWAAFDDQVANTSVLVTEEVLKERPGSAVRLFHFLSAAPGVSAAEFEERWRLHAIDTMRSADLTRPILSYVHNHPIAAAAADEALGDTVAMGLRVSGIAELGFASKVDLRSYLSHSRRAAVRPALAEFADPAKTVTIATGEVTMCNRVRPEGRAPAPS